MYCFVSWHQLTKAVPHTPADEDKVIEDTRREAFKVFQNDHEGWLGTPFGKK